MAHILSSFFVSKKDPDHILWVIGSQVVNGGWTPTFSDDRMTLWCGERDDGSIEFVWAGTATINTNRNYNDVIEEFRARRSEGSVQKDPPANIKVDTEAFRKKVDYMCLRPEELAYLKKFSFEVDAIQNERDQLRAKLNQIEVADLHSGRGWDRPIA